MQSLPRGVLLATCYKRRYIRKLYEANIAYGINGRVRSGELKDISKVGAYVFTRNLEELAEGQVITLSIPFTDGKQHVKCKGRLNRIESDGFAVEFG